MNNTSRVWVCACGCSSICPSVYLSLCLITGGKKKCARNVFLHSPFVGGTDFTLSYMPVRDKAFTQNGLIAGSHLSAEFHHIPPFSCEPFLYIISKPQCLQCGLLCIAVHLSMWCHRSRALLCWVLHLSSSCVEEEEVKGTRTRTRTPSMALFIGHTQLCQHIKAMLKIACVS